MNRGSGEELREESVLLDPSIIFEQAVTDPLFRDVWPGLRMSAALTSLLRRPESFRLLEPFGRIPSTTDAGRVLQGLDGHSFSWRRAELAGEEAAVLRNLLELADPLAEIYADEWAFIVSQSSGIFGSFFEKVPHTIDRFIKAGAKGFPISRQQMDRVRQAMVDVTPEPLRHGLKDLGKLGKPGRTIVLGVGGFLLTRAVPILGDVVFGATMVPPAAAFIYGDP